MTGPPGMHPHVGRSPAVWLDSADCPGVTQVQYDAFDNACGAGHRRENAEHDENGRAARAVNRCEPADEWDCAD